MDRLYTLKKEFLENYKNCKDIDDKEHAKLYLKKFSNVSTKINYINNSKIFSKKSKTYKDSISSQM
jgi:hypothetical protein